MGEQTEYARRVVDLIKEYDLEDIRKFPYAAHYVMGIAARKIERITAQLEQVTRERDAAANDLYYVRGYRKEGQNKNYIYVPQG